MDILTCTKIKPTEQQADILVKVADIVKTMSATKKKMSDDVTSTVNAPNKVITIAGYAGTGKTSIANNIISYCKHVGYSVNVLAPTNKAVQVLKQKLPNTVDLSTVHSFLYGEPDDDDSKQWTLSTKKSFSVIMVDECSMVDKKMYDDIIECCVQGCLIIFMGDEFQLEPVGKPSPVFNMNIGKLTNVIRQAGDSTVLATATVVRNIGRSVCPNQSDSFVRIYQNDNELVNTYIDTIKAKADSIFIVDTNKSRVDINKYVRKSLGYSEGINCGEKMISIANGDYSCNGEIFLVSETAKIKDVKSYTYLHTDSYGKAKYNVILANIDGVIHFILPDFDKPSYYHQQILKTFSTEDGRRANQELYDALIHYEMYGWWYTNRINDSKVRCFSPKPIPGVFASISRKLVICTYGYAISCHKSQGSQFTNVFLHQYWDRPKWDTNRWYYTAITRTSKRIAVALNNKCISFVDGDYIRNLFESHDKKDSNDFEF